MRFDGAHPFRMARIVAVVVVVLAPAILTSALVARHYVPIPYWDEWELAPLISAERVSVRDFFVQHNEHRHFFPKLILTLLARSTGWNLRIEPALNIIFALLSVVALLMIMRPQSRGFPLPVLVTAFALSAFVFSPAQFEVWLWPWMIVSTMTTLLLCLSALLLVSNSRMGWLGAIALCSIAGLTSAQGLFLWIALLPSAIWDSSEQKINGRRLGIWLACATVSWSLYLAGFKSSADSGILQNLMQPVDVAKYVVMTLGAPWTRNDLLAATAGVLQLLLLAWALLVARRTDPGRALALFGVAVWVLMFAGATAAGRLHLGMETALSSRYLASSVMLPCSFFVLIGIIASQQRLRRLNYLGAVLALLIVSGSWLFSIHASTPIWNATTLTRERGALCLAMSRQTMVEGNLCLKLLYPSPEELVEKVSALESRGVRTFRLIQPVPVDTEKGLEGTIYPRSWQLERGLVKFTGLVVDPSEASNTGLIFLDVGATKLWCCGFSHASPTVSISHPSGPRAAKRWSAPIETRLVNDSVGVSAFTVTGDPARLRELAGRAQLNHGESEETRSSARELEHPDPDH